MMIIAYDVRQRSWHCVENHLFVACATIKPVCNAKIQRSSLLNTQPHGSSSTVHASPFFVYIRHYFALLTMYAFSLKCTCLLVFWTLFCANIGKAKLIANLYNNATTVEFPTLNYFLYRQPHYFYNGVAIEWMFKENSTNCNFATTNRMKSSLPSISDIKARNITLAIAVRIGIANHFGCQTIAQVSGVPSNLHLSISMHTNIWIAWCGGGSNVKRTDTSWISVV
ncbi:hypothetical protein BDF19DRAFT_119180 [Syncephalis fuscata]|nr:hypothetical protein BDF19DRAFT_119180 [Syncephalis fuscata]